MSRSAKRLLFGAVLTLFSLMLVFAAFVSLQVEVAGMTMRTFTGFGQDIIAMVWVAIIVGIVGLAVALLGITRND
ncbi:MAG: hypothetical protein C5B60_06095 [Chloroflexi bacterium]|nr:MAG: hypothetical protein C5B60_06095 [Chloroflexota bacterium]